MHHMQNHRRWQRLISLVIAAFLLASPLVAQQRRGAPKRSAAAETAEPPPAFDSLLATESYKVYCEVRAVGGLVRSPGVNDLLDPMMKLGRPPKEFKTLVKWLNSHAEILAGSRLMVAGWPSRPNLPNVLVAIEFSSPEEAKKFYPELRDFLPKLLPTPTPVPVPSPAPVNQRPIAKPVVSAGPRDAEVSTGQLVVVPVATTQNIASVAERENAPSQPPYQMRQVGSLVLISDTTFTFKNLRPRGSKPLEEDQNFQLARNRFATESLFLYVDLKSIEKEEKAQRQKWEEEARKRAEAEAANPPKIEEKTAELPEVTASPGEEELPPPPAPEPSIFVEPIPEVTNESVGPGDATLSAGPQRGTDEVGPMFVSLYTALFGGETKWPEAVGAALVFENDGYVIRTLIINSEENKGNAIPFIPQFVSGPAIVPQSPEVFPADTNLFVSVSLDYPQIYEGMLKAMTNAEALSAKYDREPPKDGPTPESPFAIYEKKLGLKIKDDLLPLLGNEMALALAKKPAKLSNDGATNPSAPTSAMADTDQKETKPADPSPVVAISVKDREAVARLIPKIIESFGLKGADMFAQKEKRDDTEITSYAGAFSYAFVGDFLIVSPDAAATRHVVDAYLNHQTLSSDSHFRNFTRWQPHQVLGQVYVGPDLVANYNPFGFRNSQSVSASTNEFLSRLSPLIEPTTYVLSNDGSGPLHELHIPKNLLQWMIGTSLPGFEAESLRADEAAGENLLRGIYNAETSFLVVGGSHRYGTFDELLAANLISSEGTEHRYILQITASANKFEATAIPIEYGVSGTLSYFIDESGILRAGDHGGGSATVADQPVD
jgi:hypothetical protein